ncbi:TPA: phage protein [Enterobacter asburiae]
MAPKKSFRKAYVGIVMDMALARSKISNRMVAQRLGVDETTIRRWRKENIEFERAFTEAREALREKINRVTVAMGGPKNTMTIGADGEVMHSLHVDKSGTVFLSSPALTCWRSTPIWGSDLSWWWSVTTAHRITRRKPTWAAAVIYWYQRSKHVTELDETFRAAARGRERAGY